MARDQSPADPNPCQCCGSPDATEEYHASDRDGHVWTHRVCVECERGCEQDGDGLPVCRRAG